MRQVKISKWLASAVVCSLLLAAGCANKFALRFTPQDSTTCRVISETERSIKWEGSLPEEPAFKGGRNHDRLEMTFAQEIQSVDDKGNAIAKIIIKELKYSSIVKDSSAFEFDSSKPKDPNHPLAKLIGQSYTLKIAPTGEVTEVIDTKEAETAVRKGSVPPGIALRLLNSEVIKERHGTLVLPDADKNQLHIGDNWSSTRTFSFGMMGSESYEKIYTLKEIKKVNNHQIAVAEMKAIPSSEMAEELHKEQTTGVFSKMFDNTETYSGQLKLDLTAGKVQEYFEKLRTEWVMVDPRPDPNKEPAALKMAATRLYSLEKID